MDILPNPIYYNIATNEILESMDAFKIFNHDPIYYDYYVVYIGEL